MTSLSRTVTVRFSSTSVDVSGYINNKAADAPVQNQAVGALRSLQPIPPEPRRSPNAQYLPNGHNKGNVPAIDTAASVALQSEQPKGGLVPAVPLSEAHDASGRFYQSF